MPKSTRGRDKLTLRADALAQRHGPMISLPVERTAAGVATVRLEPGKFRGAAEHTFPVQCAFARVRHEFDELLFLQLEPYDEKKIVRMIVVRFTSERTAERVASNEPFRQQIEDFLTKNGKRGEVGYYTRLAEAARPPNASIYSADLDAEADLLMFSGYRAAALFLTASSTEIVAATQGAATVSFTAQVEVTMSTRALADLLLMWKDLHK